jgi:Terminase large subunit, T4likevirus-type, N-terminal
MATASGRGCGKTTLTAWLAVWILCTRPRSQGVITANSWQQLRDRSWSAIQHWLKLSLFNSWFVTTSDRIHFRSMKESWFLSAQSSKPENAQSFAGQHAANSTSYVIADEASEIDDRIFAVVEGSLSDGEPQIHLFGNMTRTEGQFFRAVFGSERHRWIHASIDSRDCSLPNGSESTCAGSPHASALPN